MTNTTDVVRYLLELCAGKPVIAYGLGKVGEFVIPYLAQELNIQGVSDSRVIEDDAGTFLDILLPVRSIQAWHQRLPDAVILVTTTNPWFQKDILDICQKAGFQEVRFLSKEKEKNLLLSKLESLITMNEAGFYKRMLPKVEARLVDRICHANELRDIHRKTFSEFRNCNRGKEVVLVATGPSLNYYVSRKGAVHIGVNTAFLKDGISLDYYFAQDYGMKGNRLRAYPKIKAAEV